ncbi:MAG: acetyl-CoA decarbonylase/synthase complex subunit alpha, partial [Deltaproteobacteria bacterium]|nr:acetyl-CoA decarbonylase/synthase complex subunit alpha [Deltaproteobacteria bacterium]
MRPDITDLRDWDFKLLDIYKPSCPSLLKTCHLCALGPCSFAKQRYGRCGIDEEGFKAREVLLCAVLGASAHTSLARRLLEELTSRYGRNCPINMGELIGIKTPLITLICGITPETLGDMEGILSYIERQLTHLLSSINYGAEASSDDFISKALHTGMLDSLALEVADIAQISALNFPKGISNSHFVDIGLGKIGRQKPFILVIGHNSLVGVEIVHLLEGKGLKDKVEVGGLCCAASDLSRHYHGIRIIGNQADQLEVISSGIADVV